jgi:hypothetical protein
MTKEIRKKKDLFVVEYWQYADINHEYFESLDLALEFIQSYNKENPIDDEGFQGFCELKAKTFTEKSDIERRFKKESK